MTGIVLNAGRRFATRDRRSQEKWGRVSGLSPVGQGLASSKGTAAALHSASTNHNKPVLPVAAGYFLGGEGRSVKFDGHTV